jgi:NAD(P)-dependent dehydrogenase (short-subunit alcohol dehydrogenase family)
VAVVTGGASGFGSALAAQCAARGFDIALLDIDPVRVAEVAHEIGGAHGVSVVGLGVDVGRPADVDNAAAAVERDLGGADVVFSNVGVQQIGALEHFSDEAWRWMLDINVIGSARVARSFLPLLRRSTDPHLVFTASASVMVPATHLAAYQATKFAVLGIAETLRLELAPDAVAVSVLFPSGMTTRHLESSLLARPEAVSGEIAPTADIEAMLASNAGFASDVATPEEAARNVLDAVLAGETYIVTHGDLVAGLVDRQTAMLAAAEQARDRKR